MIHNRTTHKAACLDQAAPLHHDSRLDPVNESLTAHSCIAKHHPYPGVLIAFEGIDGCGKSTQIKLLHYYLKAQGHYVELTSWNSSDVISPAIKQAKKKKKLTPELFSLLHAADFASRYEETVVPALLAGRVVLADRYLFTGIARDSARQCNQRWVRGLYSFAYQPDITFYFKMPVKAALERIIQKREPKYYESGMDLSITPSRRESFILFQSKVLSAYEKLADEFGFMSINGLLPIYEQQHSIRNAVSLLFKRKEKQ